ncbi:MAG: hypothetical protein AB1352_04450 [Patescibacteria group bacterium]
MTLYLWDLAGTLFKEGWKSASGFESYDEWIEMKLRKGRSEINDEEYERGYRLVYGDRRLFYLDIQPGFEEVLHWTKHNETFSTGVREQMDWRAQYLNSKVGFDIRKYFQKFNSTFDYGKTNVKTKEMLLQYLTQKYHEGYQTVVYSDDKLSNCRLFQDAAEDFCARNPDFSFRIYLVINEGDGIKKMGRYWEAGNLHAILKNEKAL